MKAVIQRVSHASVEVVHKITGKIGKGLVVLLGINLNDTTQDVDYLTNKIAHLRIFEDENHKMNLSLLEISGELLAISQFTLCANTRKGRRPSFVEAAPPAKAEALYNSFIEQIGKLNIKVSTGIFGATMMVNIHNDGPVTITIDSTDRYKSRN